jgi:glycosyltransferase involved in cell wall biosynthesis
MFNATLSGLLSAQGKYDIIYATSPPLFVGGAALAVSYFRRIPLVFEVRDLWPESAVALGEITNQYAVNLATRLEEACYKRARAIVVVTRGIYERLVGRGIPEEKLIRIPNGANVDLFSFHANGRERIRRDLGLENKFIVIYAGIHGVAQGLEIIVEIARQLRDLVDIHFLFVGDGPKKAEIKKLANQYALLNLTFLDPHRREDIPDFLSAADLALVPLKNIDLFKGALPTKLFDAWACERPVLLNVDGEARQVLERAGGGLFAPPENLLEIKKAILHLKNDSEKRKKMGKKGRAFTCQYYSRETLAKKLISLLEGIIDNPK